MRRIKIHFPDPKRLNNTMCGKYPVVTCHIGAITCDLCKRLMARRGYFGDFIFDLSLEGPRIRKTFSR